MWANTVWGLFGCALTCLVGRTGVSDPGTRAALLYATWVFVVAGLIVLSIPFVRRRLDQLFRKPPLVILFDPSNPAKRFWSLESAPHPTDDKRHIPYFETRLEIKNQSDKTLRNVRVSVARTGASPSRHSFMPFDKTKAPIIDINPGCSELVPIIRWPHPRVQEGMLADESALAYGPIEVVVSADDVPAVTRKFNFDYQRDPMIYD